MVENKRVKRVKGTRKVSETTKNKLKAMGKQMQEYARKIKKDKPGISHREAMRLSGAMYKANKK